MPGWSFMLTCGRWTWGCSYKLLHKHPLKKRAQQEDTHLHKHLERRRHEKLMEAGTAHIRAGTRGRHRLGHQTVLDVSWQVEGSAKPCTDLGGRGRRLFYGYSNARKRWRSHSGLAEEHKGVGAARRADGKDWTAEAALGLTGERQACVLQTPA